MELSKYQRDIIDYYEQNPRDNMMIRALAGSGKTFIAERLLSKSKTSDVYIAFNTSIAKEFGEKITNPKVKVKTIHALAYSIMLTNIETEQEHNNKKGLGKKHTPSKKVELDNFKIYQIIDTLIQKYSYSREWDFEEQLFYKEHYCNLYNLCRLTFANIKKIEHIRKLIHDYGIFSDYTESFEMPSDENIMRFIKDIHNMSWADFEDNRRIDFTDMLYITYCKIIDKEWTIPFYHYYTNIIADEAQDFNNLQLKFLQLIKRRNGRYVFILDENQAIYHFSGANANSFKIIPKIFTPMKEFDLPINYRCPTSHLSRVNTEFGIPIKPRPNAPKGSIATIDKQDIIKHVKSGDMIISRKNKWLTDVILNLVSNGVPVYMQDKDFVEEIKGLIPKQKAKTLEELGYKFQRQIKKLTNRIMGRLAMEENQEANINTIDSHKLDLYNFITPIYNFFLKEQKGKTVESFISYLNTLLNISKPSNCVRICSVHKAKGLEADNVFVLNEAKTCTDARNTFEQNQQERNLSYISITRAKDKLYLVREKHEGEDQNGKD